MAKYRQEADASSSGAGVRTQKKELGISGPAILQQGPHEPQMQTLRESCSLAHAGVSEGEC